MNINALDFAIDDDRFSMQAGITQLMGNTAVKATMVGHMDLSKIVQAYPVPDGMQLQGILDLDLGTEFTMDAISAKDYGRTKTQGNLKLANFKYQSPDLNQAVTIAKAAVQFDPDNVVLQEFIGRTGQTDFSVSGRS